VLSFPQEPPHNAIYPTVNMATVAAQNNMHVHMPFDFGFAHNVYASSFKDLKDYRPYVVTSSRHLPASPPQRRDGNRQQQSKQVADMPGFLKEIPFWMCARDVGEEPEYPARGLVTLLIGQTPFSLQRRQMLNLLHQLTDGKAKIHALRQQFRPGTQRRQVTGVWFVDVHANDAHTIAAWHRRVLLHEDRATVFEDGAQRQLFAWCSGRDRTALAQARAQGQKFRRPLQPMTVEIQYEDRFAYRRIVEMDRRIEAVETYARHFDGSELSFYCYVAASMETYTRSTCRVQLPVE